MYPTIAELNAIEAKAHRMRAEALRSGFHAVATHLKSRFQLVRFYLSRRQHA